MKYTLQTVLKKASAHLYVLLFFLCSSLIHAQDFHLSQYDAAPLFLNPSMTGMFDGKFRAHLHYRTQWAAVSTKPFTTAGVSFDMPIKKFGVGLQIMNLRAGAGSYNALNAVLSFSYDLASKTNMHHLALGVQAGIIQKSIRPDKFFFGNQYDAVNGGGFNTDLSSGETFKSTSFVVPAINAGALYYFAKTSARLNPFIGFSLFNLTQPEERFFDSKAGKLYMRTYIHGGIKINVNEKIQLLPKLIHMQQLENRENTVSLLMFYFLKDANTYLMFGPTYRFKDAAIIEGGIKKGPYLLRLSYDVNISPLKSVSYYKGGFEISLTYTYAKPKINQALNCPRL